jgi:glycosyltransferase involved in cell wall biosynthesis
MNEISAVALPPAGPVRTRYALNGPWWSWYKVNTSAPTLPRARGRAFRAFFHLGALYGVATGSSVIRIGMLGTRGVPASYSGFETCVEELGTVLAARGHDVTVYCRVPHITYKDNAYRGMRLVKLPTIRSKHLDTITHSLLSAVHALSQRYDITLFFNVGCSVVTWIPRLAGQRVILNVDGLDWKRKKWGRVARWYLRASERWATRFPHRLVTDSRQVQGYYLARYASPPPTYIAYGAEPMSVPPGRYLEQYGLVPGRYILFVGRLVPENCAHHLVESFVGLATDFRCVIVGDAPYAATYINRLRATTDPRVIFTGYLFGEGYRELAGNAYCFVETSEVGGTHPALLEAMGLGRGVVVNDTPENLETIADAGFSYEGSVGAPSLRAVLERLLKDPAIVHEFGERARERVREHYSWESVTDAYEQLFLELLNEAR